MNKKDNISNNVDVQIGKNGFNQSTIDEIKKHIKAKKNVKLKLLKSFIGDKEREEISLDIQNRLNLKGKLIGNTIMFRGDNG